MRRLLLLLPLLASCTRDPRPPIGLPEERAEVVRGPAVTFATREDVLRYVIAGDPLARRPRLPDPAALVDVPDAGRLADLVATIRRLEQPGQDIIGGLDLLARRHAGSEVTALTRGYRLGIADRIVGAWQAESSTAEMHELAPLLTSLRRDPQASLRTRNALEVLQEGGLPFPTAVRRTGDRWVLVGWLDRDVPLAPVVEALSAPAYDALRESRLGELVLARAERRAGDPAEGFADLTRATALALQHAAADRHREQAEWADTRAAAEAELGGDPIPLLLDRAAERLTAAAGDPAATGGALVALTARRLIGGCDWSPCAGLDRVETLGIAARWSPEAEAAARAWRVIALKRALDTMEVGRESVLFRSALRDLVDALLGTGAVPMSASVLTRTQPEPEIWALLGGSVGEPTAGSWEDARVALGRHLASVAREALETADSSWVPWLERISRRAVP